MSTESKSATISESGVHVVTGSVLSSGLFSLEDEIVVDVSCGKDHAALVTESGKAFTFGSNGQGQLGLENSATRPTLVDALAAARVGRVSCGDNFTLFLSTVGELFSCGDNTHGQLGLGHKNRTNLPTKVADVPPLKMVAAGSINVVALALTGEILLSGHFSTSNQTHMKFSFVVSVRTSITSVSCCLQQHALVTSTGMLFMIGQNASGQLGIGHNNASATYGRVPLPSPVKAVHCGPRHTVAITTDGAVWTWGSNDHGQLGVGSTVASSTPQRMMGLENVTVTQVVAGNHNTVLITKEGGMRMCGKGGIISLGEGQGSTSLATPVTKSKGLVIEHVAITDSYVLITAAAKRNSKPPPSMVEADVMLSVERLILKVLECPICFQTMCTPIHQCSEGHGVCDACRDQTTQCSICRKPYSEVRNLGLEGLAAEARVSCTDCGDRLPTNVLKDHGDACPNRTYGCVVPSPCGWSGPSSSVLDHVLSNHSDLLWQDFPYLFAHDVSAEGIRTDVLVAHSRVFLLRSKYEADRFHAVVALVGPANDCPRYKYQLEFVDVDDEFSSTVRKTVCPDSLSVDRIFDADRYVVIDDRALPQFLRGQKLMCQVTILEAESNNFIERIKALTSQ